MAQGHRSHDAAGGALRTFRVGRRQIGEVGLALLQLQIELAGQAGVAGHLKIASDCRFAGDTVVLRDVEESGDYMGHPMMTKRQYLRLMRDQRRSVGDKG